LTDWLDQPGGCPILPYGTLLIGFCQFFLTDPDGRTVAVQTFPHDLPADP
jgi:hypothetical protein